ncbi:MAG: flagellar biosynthesis protein FlhF [Burkholderiales bacterium]|nr:flagellar biosynthesis protein FlhF [Burkholderiales bacterium]
MKPRKFFGATSREVLKLVREALGPDALIVSNAKVSGGIEVIALPSHSLSELVAGAAHSEVVREAVPDALSPRRNATLDTRARAADAAESSRDQPHRPAPGARAAPLPVPAPVEGLRQREPGASASERARAAEAIAPAAGVQPQAALADGAVQEMIAELRTMRAVLEQRLFGLAWTELSRRDPAKVGALRALLSAGFSGELARRLTEPMPEGADEQEGMRWLAAEINRNLVTAGADNDIIERGGVYAIIGPTGVGKTTTTAKLAARAVVRHGADRVALLTTDTYRIGAHEQLRIYGRILGVTTSVVRAAADLKATLADLRGKHMVLIDTIGMSQRDQMVAEQAAALRGCGGNVKRMLLLNATCNGDTLEDVVRCYEPGAIDGCILTKLDEAQSIGAAIDVLIRHRLALNFVANGQRVPEDLHVPNRQYLIHRALRAAHADSAFGLEHEEFPLVLAAARDPQRADAAQAFGARLGAYVA